MDKMNTGRLWPSFIMVLIVAMTILATIYIPHISGKSNNGPVVTSEIKSLDAGLRRLKANTDAGKIETAKKDLSIIGENWVGLKQGLVVRGMENSASAITFEQSLKKMQMALTQDKGTISLALKPLNNSLSQLKSELQTTSILDKGRFSLIFGSFLVLWLGLVLVIPALAQKLSLKQ